MVAVVGSFGKTTTTRAAIAALGGNPESHRGLNAYTAAALRVLAVRPRARHAVLELSVSRPGLARTLARMTRPDVVVVTAIGSEHNRSMGSLEVTRAEKAGLVEALSPSGVAVLNGDDPGVRSMATRTTARVVTFGLEPGNDVRATDVTLEWPDGTSFLLHAGGVTRPMRVRLLGRGMVRSILAGVAVALAEDRPIEQALAGLEALPPAPGRLRAQRLESGAYLLRDEVKSAVETIDEALDVLAAVPARRRIVVLGDVSEPLGSQGPIYRRVGERVAGMAARLIVVGGGFQRYAAGARRAGLPRDSLVHASAGVSQAVEELADLGPGDVVLVKGRDTQRLERVSLALAGRQVRCELRFCNITPTRCEDCPMLERGWRGRSPAV